VVLLLNSAALSMELAPSAHVPFDLFKPVGTADSGVISPAANEVECGMRIAANQRGTDRRRGLGVVFIESAGQLVLARRSITLSPLL
jgi:hypothetical protein